MIRVAIYAAKDARRRELIAQIGDRVQVVESAPEVVLADRLATADLPVTAAPIVRIGGNSAFGPGVHAVLPVDATADEMLAAIAAARQELFVLTSEQASRFLPGEDMETLSEHLTTRELEVLRLLADGSGNKQIAGVLNISSNTAKFHVAQILAKLGVGSRAEAVAIGIRRGLIPI